ncbi:MAG: hypothetical protein M1816_002090 [Peltula sp. TS41687]|nr:MAG: hypothetical protein M1816_002090 [Peltula sp. TS41687]
MAQAQQTQSQSRSALLRTRAVSFCNAFLTQTPPTHILDEFFVPDQPTITEHAPEWAQTRLPFLSRTFVGRKTNTDDRSASASASAFGSGNTCDDYFRLLGETLVFVAEQSSFPPPEGFLVDADAERTEDGRGGGVVMVVGKGVFRSTKTDRQWRETFVHRLSRFDEQGRIGRWEIWADPLSAWAAVGDEEGEGGVEAG